VVEGRDYSRAVRLAINGGSDSIRSMIANGIGVDDIVGAGLGGVGEFFKGTQKALE